MRAENEGRRFCALRSFTVTPLRAEDLRRDFVSSSIRGNRAVGKSFCLPGCWGEDSDRNWTGHAAPNAGMSFRFLGVTNRANEQNILRCVNAEVTDARLVSNANNSVNNANILLAT